MNIILLGPPGSGKSTQAALLAQKLNIPHISVGKILRNIAQNPEHPFFDKVKNAFTSGNLVDYDIVDSIVYTIVDITVPCGGFIMDGFPRVEDEIEPLDIALGINNSKLDLVLYIDTDFEEAKKRILNRKENRPDDNEKTIETRFKVYTEQTLPVLHEYKKRMVLRKVDGNLDVQKIHADIVKILDD